jgi:hypothetical protein
LQCVQESQQKERLLHSGAHQLEFRQLLWQLVPTHNALAVTTRPLMPVLVSS